MILYLWEFLSEFFTHCYCYSTKKWRLEAASPPWWMNEWMMKSQKTFTSKELQIIVILLLFHQIKLKFILYWPNLKFIINGAKQFSNLPPISRTRKWWPYCFPILNNSLAILIALSKLFSSRELEPTWNLQDKIKFVHSLLYSSLRIGKNSHAIPIIRRFILFAASII